MSRTATAPSALRHGWCWTTRLQRYQKRCSLGRSRRWGTCWRSEPLKKKLATNTPMARRMATNEIAAAPKATPTNTPTTTRATAMRAAPVVTSMRSPTQPSSAGSSVSDTSDHQHHADRRGEGDGRDELETDQRQTHQRDDDGGPGEDHRPTAGVDRLRDGVLRGEPGV